MPKQLLFHEEARLALKRGLEKSARAVKYTYGPRGRNVLLDQGWGSPKVTRDGADITDEIELTNPYENLAAQILKEGASKTNDQAGDGTTTTSILTEAIFSEGLKYIMAGANAMALGRGLSKAVDYLVNELKSFSTPVTTQEQIRQIATIAAANDEAVGKMLAEAMEKVSKDGVITIEEGKGMETEIKVVEGMQFDRGFISPYFVTNQENMQAVLEEPYILIYEDKLSNAQELVPLLEKVAQTKKSLLVIAEDVEGEALATLVVNKIKGILACAAVKAPGYGDRRKEMLEDIAILTDARPIFKDLGVDLKKLGLDSLGRAKKVVIDSENTTITEGAGSTRKIQERIAKIRREIKESDSDYDKEKLQERLAKLAGGVAQINIGAATEAELKEKKSRAESALSAIRAAVEEGFVPGGGVTFLKLADKLDNLKLEGDEEFARMVLKKALEAPIRHLAENAGRAGSELIRHIRNQSQANLGYDIVKEEYVDMVKSGVLDPTKVVRLAIQNAASVAEMLLISDVAVTEIPEEEPAMPGGRMPPGEMPY